MATETFIAFINPAVCAILATALFVFWFGQRRHSYIAVLGTAFGLLALGFAGQFFSVQSEGVLSRLAANSLLILGAAMVVVGMQGRYARRVPVVTLSLFAGSTFGWFAWFLLIDPNTVARIFIINFGCGFLVLLVAAELRKTGSRRAIDRLLFWLFAAWGAQFFLRTALAVAFEGGEIVDANFFASLYWGTLTFSIAFFLLIYAVAIVAAIAIDLQEELRAESFTDPLSGLLNRRGFNTRLDSALRKAREQASPIALVVADLDRFKEVNDRFGHAVGDVVIVSFADCLREAAGDDHVVGRMGGEEFAILLHGADIRMARLFAEGLRTRFAALAIPGLPAGYFLSASFGVATLELGEDWEDLLKRADRALYHAKAEGRDRVAVCTDSTGLPGSREQRFPEARDGFSTVVRLGG